MEATVNEGCVRSVPPARGRRVASIREEFDHHA